LQEEILLSVRTVFAGPSCLAVLGVGLRPLACWNCGFESRWGHGCQLWVLCVVR